MSITPHPSYEFGFVDGLFVKAVADRGPQEDEDRRPDFIPATDVGVKFTPVVSARKIIDAPSMYVTKTPTAAIVAQDGRLRLRGQESEPPGIGLIAGVYNVTFTGVPLPSIQIEVLPTHTEQNPLDLITVLPYEPAPNEIVHLVALPPGGEPGQVYGWTGSGIGWYTPEQPKGIASIQDSDGDGIATVTYTDSSTSSLTLPSGPEGPAGLASPTVNLTSQGWASLTGETSGHTGSDTWRRGRMYLKPVVLVPVSGDSLSIAEWGINITAAGGPSAIMRVGIYGALADGRPDLNNLLVELAFPGTATGAITLIQPATIPAGLLYVAHVPQADTGDAIPVATGSAPNRSLNVASSPINASHLSVSGTSGALPVTSGNPSYSNESTGIHLAAKGAA